LEDELSSDGDLLLLATGKLRRQIGGTISQAELCVQLLGSVAGQATEPKANLVDHPVLGEGKSTDAEVTEFILVGQLDDVGQVPHAGLAYLVLDVERVLERRALAGAGPMPHPNDEYLMLAPPPSD